MNLQISLLPLSKQDLALLIVWPIFNAFIVCTSLYYIMPGPPMSSAMTLNVILAAFSKCALFWLFRRIFEATCQTAFRLQVFHQIAINLLLISLAFAIFDIGFTTPATFDSVTVFQLFRLKLLTYLNMLLQVTIYTVVLHSWQLKQRGIELEMSLKQSEISLLRMQTNPHFLFNTLNLLHSEIPDRPELAQELILELSDLLRGTIAIAEQKRILLGTEIDLIEHYLTIQKARFVDRLEVIMDIESTCQRFSIPPMLILPLVENVIKHALSKTIKRITLKVKIHYVEGELRILVSNSWPESSIPKFEPGSGHSNISNTLKLEFTNSEFSMDFGNQRTFGLITIRHNFKGDQCAQSVVN